MKTIKISDVSAIAIIVVAVSLIISVQCLFIWAINTLFTLNIPITVKNWFAVEIIFETVTLLAVEIIFVTVNLARIYKTSIKAKIR